MNLYPTNPLRKRTVQALDGELGQCDDFLFDHEPWIIRYLVLDTRKWLPGRKVVVSPSVIDPAVPLNLDGPIKINLTRDQIRESPPLEEHAPISMKIEAKLAAYYQWPTYWIGPEPWGESASLPALTQLRDSAHNLKIDPEEMAENGERLRSAREVAGYSIEAEDGALGHVEGFFFDREAWKIRLLALDTRNWLPGRKLALLPESIVRIDPIERKAQVEKTRRALRHGPEVDPTAVLSAAQFAELVEALHAA